MLECTLYPGARGDEKHFDDLVKRIHTHVVLPPRAVVHRPGMGCCSIWYILNGTHARVHHVCQVGTRHIMSCGGLFTATSYYDIINSWRSGGVRIPAIKQNVYL